MNLPTMASILASISVLAIPGTPLAAAKAHPASAAGQAPAGDGSIRRYCLAIGSNFGGPALDSLLYAGSDAATFGRVLGEMGGVKREDTRLLENPTPAGLDSAFAGLRDQVLRDRLGRSRTEVVLYYSGHADSRGLLLGGNGFDYDRFRRKLDSIPADVRIAVLDACASGAITRLKGGKHRPAFTVDASSDMRGYAFITSSSPEEASQESDQIGSSFFTHYLVSGLRGAADVSGDGKVTLGEAYQFAFHETLARTERTKGGPQHPAYDMKLSGTGDVVMTDMRATSSELVLGKDLEGRFFIRNPKGELVAELFKPGSRQVELGLPPGAYSIRLERNRTLDTASILLAEGGRETLSPDRFGRMPREATAFRGGGSDDSPAAASVNPAAAPSGVGFEYSDQIDMRAGMDAKYALSVGLILNRQQRPFHGLQLALFFNHASMALWGGQVSVFGNFGRDSVQGAQTSVFINTASGGIKGFQGAAILNVAKGVTGGQGSAVANVDYGDLKGGQGAAVLNVARNVRGGQGAAVANFAIGSVTGGQGAAVGNFASGSVKGGQGAAVFNIGGEVEGGQGAGVINIAAGHMRGGQGAGVLNVARGVEGGQAAGVLNLSFGDVEGAQVAAVLNAGRNVRGTQASAVLNAARDVKGAQVSAVLNAARDVDGCQVGLVNISRDIRNGIPFGLINYSHTGLHSANVWMDELGFQHFTLLSGSRGFYTYLSAGEKLTVSRNVLILGAGMGGQIPIGRGYAAADMGVYDLHDNLDFDGPGPELYRLRVMAGRNLLRYLSVFGGLSLNAFWHQGGDATAFPVGGYELKVGDEVYGWPGLVAGIRIGV
ncbi:MAG: hypothetical protein JWP91_4172 [Fibrobacteres bacterium]|nr:hypothetical protein [Fibrobacterota bacterium]